MTHLKYTRRSLLRAVPALTLGIAFAPHAARGATLEPPVQTVQWLLAQQNADGGFGIASGSSDTDSTLEVLVALAAANRDVNTLAWRARRTPLQYLERQVRAKTLGGAAPSTWVLALAATGRNPAAFGGVNFVERLNATYAPATGQFGADRRAHAQSILALRRANQPVPQLALDLLAVQQFANGGWSVDAQTAADPATSALSLRALRSPDERQTTNAIAYFKAVQNPDGGFARAWRRGPSNASATAQVLRALNTLKAKPEVLSASNGNPLTAIDRLRSTDGAFQISPGQPNDLIGTAHALTALSTLGGG